MRHWDKHIEEHNVFLQSNKLLVLPGEALTHTSEPATLFLVMCLYKQQPFHCNLTIDISSVFDKQSKIRSYTLEKLNVLVHKEPPGERKKKSLKTSHFFNHFPYRVTESKRKSWFYFSIISPCFHQLPCCIFTFSTYLRTHWGPCSHILTHLSLSLVITRVAISLLVHIPALLLFLSFLLGGVWHSSF